MLHAALVISTLATVTGASTAVPTSAQYDLEEIAATGDRAFPCAPIVAERCGRLTVHSSGSGSVGNAASVAQTAFWARRQAPAFEAFRP
jgi:hypothetical protein